MERRRQRELVMGAIAALIVGVAGYRMYSAPSSTSESAATAAASARAAQSPSKRDANGLDLDALHGQRPVPVDTDRNPFRFKPKQAPPPPPSQSPRPVLQPQPPVQPVGPPPPPPIPLKFIGISGSAKTGQVAVLSDGRAVYYGRVNETIEGRYQILRIGVESIDLAYIDGRGRQTIRLTGQ